jgi:hypothetical protein
MSWRAKILALTLATTTACHSLSSSQNSVEEQEKTQGVAEFPAFLLDSSKYDSIEYAEDDRYSCVGALVADKGNIIGSAVLIHPRVILTAQHCIVMPEKIPPYFLTQSGQLIRIKKIILKENYDPCLVQNDLAICILEEDCVEPPAEILRQFYELTPGEDLITVGWSLGYKKVSQPGVMTYYGSLLEDFGKIMRMLALRGSVYYGDSGGAVFEDGGKLAGIINFFMKDQTTGQIIDNGAARLDFYYDWIDAALKSEQLSDWPWYTYSDK